MKLKRFYCTPLFLLIGLIGLTTQVSGQDEKAGPVFKDGQAQIVEAFKNRRDWINHDLWVETEFDSDEEDWRFDMVPFGKGARTPPQPLAISRFPGSPIAIS